MPVIPRAQRQVRREALPGVRLTAAETEQSTGVGVELAEAESSRALAGFGATVANVAGSLYAGEMQKARDRADSVSILEYQRKLGEWQNKRITEALGVKGKNAMGLPEEIQTEFAEITGHLDKSLSTDRQREMAARLKVNTGLGIDLTIRRHVDHEMNVYEAGELEGSLINHVNTGVMNANDPRKVMEELGAAVKEIELHGKNMGMGAEAIERKTGALRTEMHAGVIERLLSTDQDKAAKVYFEETRGQIDGTKIANIEKALEEGSLRGESQRQADAIVAAGGTLTEQRAKAKAIEDPKTRERTLALVEHEAMVAEREETEAERDLVNDAYNRVDKAGGRLSAIPPAQWTAMSGAAKSAIRSYAEHMAQGIPVKTVDAVFYKLMTDAGDKPESFIKENLLIYKAKLSSGDFQQLAGLQLNMKQGLANAANSAAQKPLDEFLTRKQVLDESLVLYGIDPNAKADTDEGKQVAQLHRLLEINIANQVGGEKGKKVTNADIQEHVDQLMISRVSKKGSWWNAFPGGEPFYDETKRYIDFKIADVPAAERDQISKALRARGRVVTDQTILDTFILGEMAKAKKAGK